MENSAIRLQMWDTAGHERFYGLIPSYIRDTMVAVIVYDLTGMHCAVMVMLCIVG